MNSPPYHNENNVQKIIPMKKATFRGNRYRPDRLLYKPPIRGTKPQNMPSDEPNVFLSNNYARSRNLPLRVASRTGKYVKSGGIIVTNCFSKDDFSQQSSELDSILKKPSSSTSSEPIQILATRSVSFSLLDSDDHNNEEQLSSVFNTPSLSPKCTAKDEIVTDKSCSNGGGILRLNAESMKLLKKNNDLDINTFKNINQKAPNYRSKLMSPVVKVDLKCHSTMATIDDANFDYVKSLIENLKKFTYGNKSRRPRLFHNDNVVDSYRQKLIAHFQDMIVQELSKANKVAALQTIWQHCYYPFIDFYRRQYLSKNPSLIRPSGAMQNWTDHLSSIISEGICFFNSLIVQLRSNYQNKLNLKFSFYSLMQRYKQRDADQTLFANLQDIAFCLKNIFVYLGDLERYYQLGKEKPSFDNAKRFYMNAHLLAPKNAHASSQLAMVFHYQKDFLNTIYYYIRSFETDLSNGAINQDSVPFATRHENKQILTIIFDTIRCGNAQYDEMLDKLKCDHQVWVQKTAPQRERILSGNSQINTYDRIEYWVSPVKGSAISKCDMHNFYDLASINKASLQTHLDLLHYYRETVLPNTVFSEVKARFIQSFLMVHGMLNCRNGLDRFYDTANQMLVEFDCLLHHRCRGLSAATNHLSSYLLLQLFIINMYTISNTLTEEDKGKKASQYGFTHRNAYFVMSSMVILICRRLIGLFEVFRREHGRLLAALQSRNDQVSSEDNNPFMDIAKWFEFHSLNTFASSENETSIDLNDLIDFYRLLPAVKVWTDWVRSSKPRFPPQSSCELNIQLICPKLANDNVWHVFGRLLTLFEQHKIDCPLEMVNEPKIDNMKHDYEFVRLPEDRFMEGFKLLSSSSYTCSHKDGKYVKLHLIPENMAHICLRIESIQKFGKYLCEQKYLRYNLEKAHFESQITRECVEKIGNVCALTAANFIDSVQQNSQFEEYVKLRQDLGFNDNDLPEDELTFDCELDELDEMVNVGMQRLHSNEPKTLDCQLPKRRFIIQPRFVIFDTNCLINDLESIKRLIRSGPFLVVIPLIVIHELQYIQARGQRISTDNSKEVSSLSNAQIERLGLSFNRSSSDNSNKSRSLMAIANKAGEILQFLKEAFVQYKSSLRTITSKGSLLKSLDYNEEFYDPNAFNNDDLVLYACTNLIKEYKDKNSYKHSKDSMMKMLEDAQEIVSHRDEYIYRDIILITDDFNLRLKSLCFEVPVKRLNQFLRWTRTF